jgi:hypothetical protein
MSSQGALRGWLCAALVGCVLVGDLAGCGGGGDDSGFTTGSDTDGGDDETSTDDGAGGGGDGDAMAGRDADAAVRNDADATAMGDGDATAAAEAAGDGGTTGDADATVLGNADGAATADARAEAAGDDAGTAADADARARNDADATMAADADAEAAGDADAMAPKDDAGDGSDGSAGCRVDNKSCTVNGHAGLCQGHVCSECADPSDDPNCTAAYGGANLCLAGTCTAGDCRTDANCANSASGGICGIPRPNFCGKCTSDQQCAGITGKPVCNTTTGQCAPGLCLADGGSVVASNPPALCPANSSDVCCASACVPAAGAFSCCPQDPTDLNARTYCTKKLGSGATCLGNVCTKCSAASNYNYTVDPQNGDDSIGTGDSTAGCAFKTITRALNVIPPNPPFPVTIMVLGGSTVQESNGEKFPIVIPKGVTITTSGGTVTVDVPPMNTGFELSAANSVLRGAAASTLVISGSGNTGSVGIVASLGSDDTTQIANLDVTGFLDDGILVMGTGVLSIGSWVSSTKNGTGTGPRSGLHVIDGHAIISPAANSVTRFDDNTLHGIEVDGSGFITVTGTVMDAAAGTGTVVARRNGDAGLRISQSGNTTPQSVVSGLVSYASPNGQAGIHIFAGSSVKLRNSVSLANAHAGIRVDTSGATGSNDISKIDLGSAADNGNNIVQAALGMNPNGGAGICLSLKTNSGATLSARGNVFEANDCAATAAGLTINKVDCSGFVDLGLEDVGTADAGVPNTIDVSKCTHP